MAERERHAHGDPQAERYNADYVPLPAGTEGAALQPVNEDIHDIDRQSWKLNSVTHNPKSQGLFLFWDTTGFFSG